MSEKDKIKRYIEKTNIDRRLSRRYDISCGELTTIYNVICENPFHGIGLLFGFGLAKGYRMAKAEAKQ